MTRTRPSQSAARTPYRPVLVGASLAFVLGACRVTPEAMQRRHWELNDMINRTSSEQLLLNIVRLRYDEMPYFLQVSSISTQFSAAQGTNASGSVGSGASGVLGLSASLSYSENPTVTWALPDSREYLGRLLAPMSADQLTVLAQSGWDAERVLRVGVKKMNRLRNMDFTVDEGVYTPPNYGDFVEVLHLVHELNKDGLIDLAYGAKSSSAAGNIPLDKMDPGAIVDGQPYGVQFMTRDDPKTFEVLKLTKPLFLRFSKESDADPGAKRLRQLLHLVDGQYSFGIVDTITSGKEQMLSESGRLSQAFEQDAQLAEIVVNNRSIMEVLYFASTYVEVPREHAERGYVDERGHVASDWLHIASSPTEPENAWMKVKYHGQWFYIAGADVTSRKSFSLLEAMFDSVVGNVPGGKPLLTLPVTN